MGCVALLKPAIREAHFLGAPVARFHQVLSDIHAQNVRTEFCRGDGRGAVTATEIENFHAFLNAQPTDEGFSAFAHGRGDLGEIALFPECFVWIHRVRSYLAVVVWADSCMRVRTSARMRRTSSVPVL